MSAHDFPVETNVKLHWAAESRSVLEALHLWRR